MQHGEFVISIAKVLLVAFLVLTFICFKFDRTERPNFKVVHRLLLHEPDMIFVRDNRGNSPLAYIPRQNWGVWNQFLMENQACFSVALK
jgi:hypothetical protein